jgi:hypothetical protein
MSEATPSSTSRRLFWNDARLYRFALALAFALIGGCLISYCADDEEKSLLSRGDFPGFYAPAVILARHGGESLYDPELQRAIENEFWPSFNGEFYMSVYPPYFDMMLAPLAWLSHLAARHLWTAVSILLFLGTLRLLGAMNSCVRGNLLVAGVASLLLAPLFIAVFGGQNTALSMFLFAAACRLSSEQKPADDLMAGFFLGFWLYKPQFGLLAIFLPLIAGRTKIFLGALVPSGIYFLLGVLAQGWSWPLKWLAAVNQFAAQNFLSNQDAMVSILGLGRSFVESNALSGPIAQLITGVALALTAGLFLYLIRLFWACRRKPQKLAGAMATMGPILVLCSPQTLFYDLGIAYVACARYAAFRSDREVWGYLTLVAALALAALARDLLPLPVWSLFAMAALCYVRRRVGEEELRS